MTHSQIVARLEEAGKTLFCLPPAYLPPRLGVTIAEHVEGVRATADRAWKPLRLVPEPAAIDRMDEAFSWLALIPRDRWVLRRIIACRLMVNPVTGAHLFPWRRIGLVLGANHKAVQRWHMQGIDLIRVALAEGERMKVAA